jgi:hypothetical protein
MTATGALLPLGQPEYEFFYDLKLRSEAESYDYADYQLGPNGIGFYGDSLGPFAAWREIPPDRLQLFAFASERFHSVRESRATGYEILRGGLTGTPFAGLSFYADFVLDEELAEDETYSGKKWRGLAGDVDQAFATYHSKRINVIAGRFGSFWGPRHSLIFSPEQKLDGFGYSLKWGHLTLSYRLGSLDGLNPDEHGVEQFEPRYIAAHRYDLHLSRSLRLGLFETVVFGGPGRQIDLFYLNPFIFFHGSQLNENLDDNTTVGFDFDYQPFDKFKMHGQVLVDDYQMDNKSQGDYEPNQVGLVVGGYLVDLFPRLDFEFEYSRVTNWTFNQMHERNRYTNDARPIGSALGNDYDRGELKFSRWWKPTLRSGLEFGYLRRGEGRIGAEWSQPWLEVEGDYSEPFPTGTVERTATLAITTDGFPTSFSFFSLRGGVDWVRHRHHVRGEEATLPFVQLRVSLFVLPRLKID